MDKRFSFVDDELARGNTLSACVIGSRFCNTCQDAGERLAAFDLSPLSRFLPAPERVKRYRWTQGQFMGGSMMAKDGDIVEPYIWHGGTFRDKTPELLRMYGWPFEEEPQQPKKPEPDPVNDFISRRIAQKKAADEEAGRIDAAKTFRDSYPERKAEAERAKALSDAMSKLPPHIAMLQERGTYWGRM